MNQPGSVCTKESLAQVPKGFYLHGCLYGGVIKRSKTVQYSTFRSEDGRWRLGRWYWSRQKSFEMFSEESWATPLEAAVALHRGGVSFSREFL